MTNNQAFADNSDDYLINQLLRSVEEKLAWDKARTWSSRDFERLSDLLFNSTNARLSVSTLKRAWGRTSQKTKLSNSTLDILANFIGEGSWQEFRRTRSIITSASEEPLATGVAKQKRSKGILLAIVVTLLLGLIAAIWSPMKPRFDSSLVTFYIQKVTSGLPNTVLFHYDIGDQPLDTLELQQTWDENRRELLDPDKQLITATYFSPGYFNAKLVANGNVIASQHVYLPSNGLEFMTILATENGRRFLPNNYFTVSSDQLEYDYTSLASNRDPNAIGYQLVNLLTTPMIDQDSFTLRASLRVVHAKEDPCRTFSLIITGAEDVYSLTIGEIGCAGQFRIYWGGETISGKYRDLSSLAVSKDEWTDLVVHKKGLVAEVQVNGRTLYFDGEISNIGDIGGIRIQSSSLLELQELILKDKKQIIDLLFSDSANKIVK